MYEFLWFVGGALTYKFLLAFLRLAQKTHVIQQLQINVLTFLGTTLEDIAFIKGLKYKAMRESKVDPNQIKKAKCVMKNSLKNGKNHVLKIFINPYLIILSCLLTIGRKAWIF